MEAQAHTPTHTLLPKSIRPTIGHGAAWPGIPAPGVTSLDHAAEVSILSRGSHQEPYIQVGDRYKGRHLGKWQ